MDDSKVLVFPENRSNSGIDASTALLMSNGGFGGMNNPLWMMFMWPMLYPMFSMFGGWGNGFGGGFGGNGGYIANQLNNDAGRELIVQAINGRADALGQLAQITHTDVNSVRDAIGIINTKLAEVGGQIGMSGLQVINAVQSGNASIAQQIANCCCENRLATCEQTNKLSSQAAANFAATQLQLAQNEAADQLAVCGQTNTILSAIKDQSIMINDKFCEAEKRELQNKINAQGDMITQLRNQISNDEQTLAFNKAMAALDDKVDAIAAKIPNTVPVQFPNLIAVNQTPYAGSNYPFGNGFGNITF